MERTKTYSIVVMVIILLRIRKLIKHATIILHSYHVTLFLKTFQSLLFAIGFP